MARLTFLLAALLPLAVAQFIPPDVILQAGYPAGFRAFIPDFRGCQQFAFHGKINTPFTQPNELGSIFQEILRPQGGFWIVQDFKLILSPGDIIHYWTKVVKDNTVYTRHNQTWKVPEPKDSVDILSPIKPPKPTPEKVEETETTPTEEVTTPGIETDATTNDETTPLTAETSKMIPTTPETSPSTTKPTPTTTETSPSTTKPTPTTAETSPPTTKPTPTTPETSPSTTKPTPTTVEASPSTTKLTPTTAETSPSTAKPISTTEKTTTTPTPTKKSPTSEKRETPNPKSNTENTPPAEDIEELTTPFPQDRPIAGDFADGPPLFPYPGLFPRPFKPMMPPSGPSFEICSNPWNFEERIGETRTQKLERQVAKLQCQLALFQRGYNQLSNTVESELTDLKKLIYGMVSRMANLESVLRNAAFG